MDLRDEVHAALSQSPLRRAVCIHPEPFVGVVPPQVVQVRYINSKSGDRWYVIYCDGEANRWLPPEHFHRFFELLD